MTELGEGQQPLPYNVFYGVDLKLVQMMTTDFGVYIHIPFCKQKCFYCDFPSFAGRERYIDEYLLSMAGELAMGAAQYGTQGKLQPYTIYIGGGTPSLLTADQLEELFSSIERYISLSEVQEFTMEANPCSLDEAKLHILKQYGVNRLSIGVQSFDDACLKRIGRLHTGQMAVEKVRLAQQMGFDNISIDLMYGLPGQTLDMLKNSLEIANGLGVQHVSIYGLQLEDGTVLAKQQEMNKLNLPSEEDTEAMYDYLVEYLPRHGFERYEISNFAQNGSYSRHNTLYWLDVPYLGFGAGAHSYWQGNRYENSTDIATYISDISQHKFQHIMEEKVSEEAHMEEFCFLGLRMTAGINKSRFKETFNKDIHEVFDEAIKEMTARGLLQESDKVVYLTPQGMKYGNIVFAEFIL